MSAYVPFRWTYRPGAGADCGYAWRHRDQLEPGDVDLTEMCDEEYTCFVEDHDAEANA